MTEGIADDSAEYIDKDVSNMIQQSSRIDNSFLLNTENSMQFYQSNPHPARNRTAFSAGKADFTKLGVQLEPFCSACPLADALRMLECDIASAIIL